MVLYFVRGVHSRASSKIVLKVYGTDHLGRSCIGPGLGVEEILQEFVYKCSCLLCIYVVTIDEERHSVDVICTLQNKQLLAILIPAVAISEVYIPACIE